MMSWENQVISFISNLIIMLLATVLSVKWALKRFRSERRWERQYAAYAGILDALHHVREYAESLGIASTRGIDVPEAVEKGLTEKRTEAVAELKRRRDVGAFEISDQAIDSLNKLFRALDKATETSMWEEYLESTLKSTDECLEDIQNIARNEISRQSSIDWKWLQRWKLYLLNVIFRVQR